MSCPHRPPCPGCPRFGEETLPPHALQQLTELAEQQGLPGVISLSQAGFASRYRVRLSVRGTRGQWQMGIFEQGSHRLVAIPDCPLHHPSLTQVLEHIAQLAQTCPAEPYQEETHRGIVRALQLAVERKSQTVQVVFVVRDKLGPGSFAYHQLLPLLEQLAQHPLVHSLWLNAQPERTNTLLGSHFQHVSGPFTLEDRSGELPVFYPPAAFGQASPLLHDQAVQQIHHWIAPGKIVAEFHAGVGSIGLGLCLRNPVRFNEIGPGSLQGLQLGIESLHRAHPTLPPELHPSVHPGPAEEQLGILQGAHTVIVDPPRKGLSPALLQALAQTSAGQLCYLSCGLDSFLRDAAQLLHASWRLRELRAYGYFPYTHHVETLALWER